MVSAIIVADAFEQIGAKLRSAREAAGLEVDDVVFRTRIPRSVVESLEAEDFSAFISPVYAKSFLAQYSEFLSVDAQPWLDALEPGSFMPGGELRALLEDSPQQGSERAPAHEHRGGLLSVLMLLTLSAALVVGVIKGHDFYEVRFGGEESQPGPVPTKPAHAVTQEPPQEPKTAIDNEVEDEDEDEVEGEVEDQDEELAKPPPRAIIVR